MNNGKITEDAKLLIGELYKNGSVSSGIRNELKKRMGVDVSVAAVDYHIRKASWTKVSRAEKLKVPDEARAAAYFLVKEKMYSKDGLERFFADQGLKLGKDALKTLYWLHEDPKASQSLDWKKYAWPRKSQITCPWVGHMESEGGEPRSPVKPKPNEKSHSEVEGLMEKAKLLKKRKLELTLELLELDEEELLDKIKKSKLN